MNPIPDKSDRPAPSAREQAARADERSDRTKSTPATDMQREDAGTDASTDGDAAAGTPSESAMKQQSKTDAERR